MPIESKGPTKREKSKCPLGAACDLTVAYMLGRDHAENHLQKLHSENDRLLRLMARAHAVMRQTGWQLAPASPDVDGDGILKLAAAEIESEFPSVLSQNTSDGGER